MFRRFFTGRMPTIIFCKVDLITVGVGLCRIVFLGAILGQLVGGGSEGGEVHGGVPGHLLGKKLELEGGGGVEVHEVRDGAGVGRLHGVVNLLIDRTLAHSRGFFRRS